MNKIGRLKKKWQINSNDGFWLEIVQKDACYMNTSLVNNSSPSTPHCGRYFFPIPLYDDDDDDQSVPCLLYKIQ